MQQVNKMVSNLELIGLLDNLRSIHNVGAIFRTADSLGVDQLILCGTTPHPHPDEPWRRDHLTLVKTSLGAEQSVDWIYKSNSLETINELKTNGAIIIALETASDAQPLAKLDLPDSGQKIVLIVGSETEGLSPDILKAADYIVKIPMQGLKESLNVSVAFGIAAFWILSQSSDQTTL